QGNFIQDIVVCGPNTPNVENRRVNVFFYGSFINPDVLARVGYYADKSEVARLDGFHIALRPLATLVPSDQHCVYGVLAAATHDQLEKLYGEEWVRDYKPEAVIVRTRDDAIHPALCYIAWKQTGEAPFEDYLNHIIQPARQLVFPAWYVERLQRLSSGSPSF